MLLIGRRIQPIIFLEHLYQSGILPFKRTSWGRPAICNKYEIDFSNLDSLIYKVQCVRNLYLVVWLNHIMVRDASLQRELASTTSTFPSASQIELAGSEKLNVGQKLRQLWTVGHICTLFWSAQPNIKMYATLHLYGHHFHNSIRIWNRTYREWERRWKRNQSRIRHLQALSNLRSPEFFTRKMLHVSCNHLSSRR